MERSYILASGQRANAYEGKRLVQVPGQPDRIEYVPVLFGLGEVIKSELDFSSWVAEGVLMDVTPRPRTIAMKAEMVAVAPEPEPDPEPAPAAEPVAAEAPAPVAPEPEPVAAEPVVEPTKVRSTTTDSKKRRRG